MSQIHISTHELGLKEECYHDLQKLVWSTGQCRFYAEGCSVQPVDVGVFQVGALTTPILMDSDRQQSLTPGKDWDASRKYQQLPVENESTDRKEHEKSLNAISTELQSKVSPVFSFALELGSLAELPKTH